MANNIRPPRVAGTFYEKNPERLRADIENRLANAPDYSGDGRILAAAVPHAGYVYSADIAAAAFKALRQVSFDTIVIIGHDFGSQAPGIIGVLPQYDAFQTPLGIVEVNAELRQALLEADPRFIVNDRVHAMEHTIEVQLPFIQLTHPEAKILPVLFGEVTPEHCTRFAELLDERYGDRSIFVLSSTDLSHYPPADTARELDKTTVAFAESMDLKGLCAWKNHGSWEGKPGVETPICSAGGLGTALCWAKRHGAQKAVALRRGNSGDVSEESRQVVGYTSLLFVDESSRNSPASEESTDEDDIPLTADVRRHLLALARQTIADAFDGKHGPSPDFPDAESLNYPAAVFVTLTKHGRLRGCIGTTVAHLPLLKAVQEYAIAAAFQDPRFPQLSPEELQDIDIEISILSPMRRVANADAIIPGKHGVLVKSGRNSGLFLPQVWEQLPDKEQFLGYLCAEKAGLPFDAWRTRDVQFFVFTVLAFAEGDGEDKP